ncbi:MAG: DUF3084 domain-containing protein [Selenomonadaceae bacterium]|nr:DUF3084 domain-containing protein [Selenomonadaceae bacterium]
MYGIILIAVMVATGGAIAFIGDKLGTKIGKKRLSIFGLRPRHTSMIITVITGILITAVTIGTMAVVSKDVRTALFGMEELNAQMASTKLALDETTENLAQMQEEFERADAELGNARTEISKLKTEQDELAAESERLKEGNERLELENSSLTAKNETLASTNENLAAANNKLDAQNKNLADANKNLDAQNKNLTSANENLSKANSALESDNKKLSEFNVTLTSDNEKLAQSNIELEERAQNLRRGLIAIREGDIVFRAGEILASSVIRGSREVEEIAFDLNVLADTASRNIAERFGSGVDTSVWIYQPEFQEAVENIAASNQDMVVRITAAGNLVRGEPIRTSLSIYPNNEIYHAGEFVFADEYEVQREDDADGIVQRFLADINRIAVARGVLPDPITGSVGVMEGSQLYELVDELENTRGKVKLTAYAREDTRSIGPIRLNIRLEREAKI